jgi:hypothetical protein
LEVSRMNRVKAVAIQACTASTFAFSLCGRLAPKKATMALKKLRIKSHSIIEPSWFPQTAEKR